MSNETFSTDPGFGEFVVSANGHFDKDGGLWLKPWTNRPGRNDIGYIVVRHPSDEVVGYLYLLADPMTGVIGWYAGPHGNPDQDTLIDLLHYRREFGDG